MAFVTAAACGGGGGDSERYGGADAAGPDAAPPPLVDARTNDAATPGIDAGTIDGGGDASTIDAPPIDAAVDAAPATDAPVATVGAWTDLGRADDAAASNERVLGAGGLAFDASGAITIVWRRGGFASGSSQSRVWGNHYTPGAGWGTPLMLQADDYDNYGDLTIVGSPDGSATAIWTQRHGFPDPETPADLWARRWVPGSGWTAAARLEDDPGHVDMPVAWVDGAGRVFVAWRQDVGGVTMIRTTHFEAATGWAADAAMPGTGADAAGLADIAIDAAGDLVAVWVDHAAALHTLRANRSTPADGWGTPVVLQATAQGPATPRLDGNAHGDAIVVWYRKDDSGDAYSVYGARYAAGAGWSASVELDHVDVTAWTPDVAIDPAGRAVAVWAQATPIGKEAWASRFAPASVWSAPARISADEGYDPRVVADDQGDAMATWWNYGHDTWARRFVPAAGWQPPTLLQHEGVTGSPSYPLPVGLPDGRVAVAMQRTSYHVAVAVYQP